MMKIGSGNYWFDPTAFVASPANRNGNTGQNIYSGPAQFSFDANLTRSFAFTDRYTLRMRLNAFQVTNTPQFNNPTTSLTSSDFGSITKAGGNRQLQIAATLNF
jgi:hypothetical protein